MADYFKQRDINNNLKLKNLKKQLPFFCEEFFVGVESQTTSLTRLNYAYDLRIFFDFLKKNIEIFKNFSNSDFKIEDLENVSLTDFEIYLDYLNYYDFDGKFYINNDKGKSRKISTVRTFYNYFYKKNKIQKNIASKITMPKLHEKDIIRLEENEVQKIINIAETGEGLTERQKKIQNNTKARDIAILTLLLGTGIRVSECVGLNINDIDFNSNSFTVTRKGGNKSILYFGDEVKNALTFYIDCERKTLITKKPIIYFSDENALFLSLQSKRISIRAVENLVKKYASIASPLKNISPHKLRSTFGTNLYHATGDIYMVADVLGHRDVNTTKKHYAAIKQDNRKIAAKVIKLKNEDNCDN